MRKFTVLFAPLLALTPFTGLSAQDLRLGDPAAVQVPAASPAAVDGIALIAEYDEVHQALKFYSDLAFVSPQGSPQFMEASASGRYLRARLEALGAAISRETGEAYRGPAIRGRGEVSFRISSELSDVFGYGEAPASRDEQRGEVIKAGYCQINYVKNNVPFLVQSDGFLKKGEVILTFDDGPGPLTAEVSDAMKEGKAPSVFFVLGSKMGVSGKELVKRTAQDGHEIAVHGYYHATQDGKPLTALSTGEILRQLGGVKESIKAAAGVTPKFFRPPYGIVTPAALRALDSELGLVPVGWTLDTLDWSTKDPEELFQKTISMIQKRGRGIVLMHDIHPQSRTAAIRLVGWLAENGYTVVSPDRMSKAYRGE